MLRCAPTDTLCLRIMRCPMVCPHMFNGWLVRCSAERAQTCETEGVRHCQNLLHSTRPIPSEPDRNVHVAIRQGAPPRSSCGFPTHSSSIRLQTLSPSPSGCGAPSTSQAMQCGGGRAPSPPIVADVGDVRSGKKGLKPERRDFPPQNFGGLSRLCVAGAVKKRPWCGVSVLQHGHGS